MLNKNVQEALNKQVNAEFYAAYLYLSMAAYYEDMNLDGFAHWMKEQSREEVGHAMKIYGHIYERGGRVKLLPIDAPPAEFESPIDGFKKAYEHEVKVTRMINDIVDLAAKENDKATVSFLQWFVDEQVEEEDQTSTIVEKMKMAGDKGHALFMLDQALAKRGS